MSGGAPATAAILATAVIPATGELASDDSKGKSVSTGTELFVDGTALGEMFEFERNGKHNCFKVYKPSKEWLALQSQTPVKALIRVFPDAGTTGMIEIKEFNCTISRPSGGKCNVCGKKTHSRCMGCRAVYYCSAEHQKDEWPTHRHFCLNMQIRRQDIQVPKSVSTIIAPAPQTKPAKPKKPWMNSAADVKSFSDCLARTPVAMHVWFYESVEKVHPTQVGLNEFKSIDSDSKWTLMRSAVFKDDRTFPPRPWREFTAWRVLCGALNYLVMTFHEPILESIEVVCYGAIEPSETSLAREMKSRRLHTQL